MAKSIDQILDMFNIQDPKARVGATKIIKYYKTSLNQIVDQIKREQAYYNQKEPTQKKVDQSLESLIEHIKNI